MKVNRILVSAFHFILILNQFMDARVIPVGKPVKKVKVPIVFGVHNLVDCIGSIEG